MDIRYLDSEHECLENLRLAVAFSETRSRCGSLEIKATIPCTSFLVFPDQNSGLSRPWCSLADRDLFVRELRSHEYCSLAVATAVSDTYFYQY